MESVYLETTFISYLVARPSRDVIVAGHQQTTQEWWANRRSEFDCSVSQVVIDEASVGDPAEVQKRLAIIGGLPALNVTETAESLTRAIMAAGILPPHAFPTPHMPLCQQFMPLTTCQPGIAGTWQTHRSRGE